MIKLKTKQKDDKEYQDVEYVSELYITEVDYLESEPDGFLKFTGVREQSNYDGAFWEAIKNNPLFQKMPSGVENAVSQKLTEMPNKTKK